MIAKTWVVRPAAPADFHQHFSDLPSIVRQVLWRRGLRTPAEVAAFLQPDYGQLADPFLFRDMSPAVELIIAAVQRRQPITVYGDYDADGVTATAVMVEALSALGAMVTWYLPERLAEGYGLHQDVIEKLSRDGTKLLIAVDCGTTNVREVNAACDLGLAVIILDHHHQPAELPPAEAIINPAFHDETYPFRGLSSAGVAFTVVRGLLQATEAGRRVGRSLNAGWEKWLLDLVAISTVADMMPLRGENRTLVRWGLTVLRKTKRPGLRALFEVMGTQLEQADEYTIGFQIGPRLNAAGRLHHASLALHLLLTKNSGQARDLARQLQELNQDRQKLTELAVSEALEQITATGEQAAYTAFAPHWSPGILGLVAGRLVERVWRPVLVMTENDGRIIGSGRSIPGFDIMRAMDAGQEHFLRFGGHPGACGFTLTSPDRRESFERWWREFIGQQLADVKLEKTLTIDGPAALSDFTDRALDLLETLGPYGVDHPRPALLLGRAEVQAISVAGAQQQHLRLTIRQNRAIARCIGFRQGQRAGELTPGQSIDVVVEASWNVWRDQKEPQLKIIDLRPSV